MKRRALSRKEEFDILKIVSSKFLLFAVFVLGLGFYRLVFIIGSFWYNIAIMIAGIVLLILFIILLVKEYEYIKL